MAQLETNYFTCPKCRAKIKVGINLRDVSKVWCGGINCAFYFLPGGGILTEREAAKIPNSYRLWDVFSPRNLSQKETNQPN